MPLPRTRSASSVGVVVALVLALAACTAGTTDPDPGPEPTSTPTTDPRPQPEDVVATAVVPEDGAEVEVAVHPIVRDGEYAVLTLDLTPRAPVPDRTVTMYGFGGAHATNFSVRRPANVRLVDLERDVIHHVGVDADDWPVVAPKNWAEVRGPVGSRVLIPYAAPAPEVTSLSVFLPGAPLVADVPVIDGEVPSSVRPEVREAAQASASAAATGSATPSSPPDAPVLDYDAIVAAPTFTLDLTSAELEGAVQTTESTERIDVQLGSDVLFDFDQATLTPAAGEALALVASRISEREPGKVSVVGHTDDQADVAYNLDLSRRRAQAVADALAGLVDTSSYPMTVEGRGEAEPFVSNESDEGRARNRRVAVTLTSVVTTRTDVTVTGELPPFGDEGQVGAGDAPLRIDTDMRLFDVRATARRVHGHVVVDLEVHGADDVTTSGWILGSLRGWNTHRGDGTTTPFDMAGRATVLQGATKLYPMDYTTGPVEKYPGGEWATVSDLSGTHRVDGGQTRVYSYVFPRLDVETVTFQVGTGVSRGTDFRLVDVPVAPGDAATGDAGPTD